MKKLPWGDRILLGLFLFIILLLLAAKGHAARCVGDGDGFIAGPADSPHHQHWLRDFFSGK